MTKYFYTILPALILWFYPGLGRNCAANSSLSALTGIQDTSSCVYTQTDRDIFDRIMPVLVRDKQLSTAELMIVAAKQLLGTPYTAGTLEQEPERLIINLHETDCILFVETCLALAQTAKSDSPVFKTFCDNVRQLRYRNGKVDGYASRIHYTSEWIRQAESRGLVKEISRELEGRNAHQKFFFMTTHADRYKQLKGDEETVGKIREIEKNLDRYEYYFIPKDEVPRCAALIRSGDIIGFNSTVPGLDIAHVGLAYIENGSLHFIHASMDKGRVIIEPRTLQEYLNDISSNNGIRVVRPIFR